MAKRPPDAVMWTTLPPEECARRLESITATNLSERMFVLAELAGSVDTRGATDDATVEVAATYREPAVERLGKK